MVPWLVISIAEAEDRNAEPDRRTAPVESRSGPLSNLAAFIRAPDDGSRLVLLSLLVPEYLSDSRHLSLSAVGRTPGSSTWRLILELLRQALLVDTHPQRAYAGPGARAPYDRFPPSSFCSVRSWPPRLGLVGRAHRFACYLRSPVLAHVFE